MQLFQTVPALLLLSTANAYTLTFYVGSECNSEELEVVNNVGGTCLSTGLSGTNAQSVEVTKEDSDSDNQEIAFHQSDDCTGQTLTLTESGCVNIDTAGLVANSYRVDTA
ncbi:uncharacterized protein N7484_004999 [Penicillium longicatenatum]|uniref:uncharacterized protein n=1 Tax=Penicillium longicatenatum TaxID=1561947 RepID=UPI0025474B9A|nr:uncharacterized protein N7484_004999 [Penicillium longicatenatum]KAJ5651276.1 hypothetical protein N7484_004999 [Penicillium longicatenatum]KAJ5671141.1 hypothetical protein N7507_000268 [Penicillium longicatenatum]